MAPEVAAESVTVGNGHHDHSARVPHTRLVPQADGPAIVLAIGTANPPDIIEQSTYHERLFAMCGISDNEALKAKFKRMGELLDQLDLIMLPFRIHYIR
jgi:hypothetical protein